MSRISPGGEGGVVSLPRLLPCWSGTGSTLDGQLSSSGAVGGGEWFQLRPRPRGSLGSLVPEPVGLEKAKALLAPGDVLVAVRAIGLNFRDVLNVSHFKTC